MIDKFKTHDASSLSQLGIDSKDSTRNKIESSDTSYHSSDDDDMVIDYYSSDEQTVDEAMSSESLYTTDERTITVSSTSLLMVNVLNTIIICIGKNDSLIKGHESSSTNCR